MKKDVVSILENSYHEQKLSHAYLFETNNVEKCFNEVISFIKKINNSVVNKLIDNNNLPSLIVIEPENKSIKKEAIEELKKTFSLTPIYTKENYYIIKYPEKMNNTAFNKMLKFLEEPEDNILGFLICENKDYVATTIVSRCEIIKVLYEEKEMHGELYEIALDVINHIENPKENIVWYNNNEIFKRQFDRNQIIDLFQEIYNIYMDAFKIDGKYQFKSSINKINIVKKYLEQLNYNININLLLNSFGIEIGELNEK